MSKKKLAGIIAVCIIAVIAVIVVTNPRQPTLTAQTYTLTTYISPSGAGSVSPAGGQYESGVQITLTATPASGYTFDYWQDMASCSSNTVSSTTVNITMNANKAITAHFKVVDHAEQGTLTVHFIDVGQGDSILLDLGDTEVLIDGGERSPGVVSYIDDYVDGPLEVMVATHPHTDHIGGLIAVLNTFEVDEIWLNGDTTTSQTYSQFMSAVNSEGAEVFTARRGDTIQAGNLTFNVLNPANLNGTINDNSIVLSLSYGQVDFLFTGDAEQEAEASMLADAIVSDVEILKVGHHGSRTASSMQFLQAAQPECAIYMAGEGNSYGHPHQETITNLCEVGAEIYGTDIHGTITVTANGVTYDVLPANSVPPVNCPGTATEEETSIGGNVQITYIFYDGIVPRTESDEYVEITNLGDTSQDLTGWVLKDISDGYPSFSFPSYLLAPGAKIRVYTNEIHSEWGGFSFEYNKAIWNNTDHDWAALYNAQGQEVSRKSY
jgi:beta-lactamase superfamily II metal-dependent hydrolase